MHFIVTSIISQDPIGKVYDLDDEGRLVPVSGGHPYTGTVSRQAVTLDAMADTIRANDPNTCFVTGTLKSTRDEARLVPKARRPDGDAGEFVSRGNIGDFVFAAEPTIWWMDADAKHLREFDTPEALLDAIFSYRNSLVDWRKLEVVVASSSSACVRGPDGALVRGFTGWRVGVVVADGSDLPRAMAALRQHHWLSGSARGAGHGRHDPVLDMVRAGWVVSESGGLLERPLLDAALDRPYALVYVGGSRLPEGYTQDRVVWVHRGGAALNTRLVPTVTANHDRHAIDRARHDRRKAAEPAAAAAREVYEQSEAKRTGLPLSVIRSRMRGVLKASDVLRLDDGSVFAVRAVLSGAVEAGTTLADPLGYDSWRANVAVVQGRHRIWSFAHGGTAYALEHDAESFEAWVLWAAGQNPDSPEHIRLTWYDELSRISADADTVRIVAAEQALADMLGLSSAASFDKVKKREAQRRAIRRAARLADGWAHVAQAGRGGAFVRGDVSLSGEQLNNRYDHVIPNIAKVWTSGALVSKHTQRDFVPGAVSTPEKFNMWTPSARVPVPGDVGVWLRHIGNLLNYDAGLVHEFMCQAAYRLQYPGRYCSRHLLLVTAQGAGKWAALYPVTEALGAHNAVTVGGEVLLEKHNGYLWHAAVVLIDELDLANKNAAYQKIKGWTGGSARIPIRAMYEDSTDRDPAGLWVVIMSNRHDCLAIEEDDRRFLVVHSTAAIMPPEQSKALFAWYEESQGIEKVAHYLLNYDLQDWEPLGAPPSNAAKVSMGGAAMTDQTRQVRAALESLPSLPEIVCVSDFRAGGAFAQFVGGDVTDKQIVRALGALGFTARGKISYKEDGKNATFAPYSPNAVLHQQAKAARIMGVDWTATRADLRREYVAQAWRVEGEARTAAARALWVAVRGGSTQVTR